MRTQQLLALSGLILAGNVAIAAKVEQDDVPNRCWDACGSVVGISRRCDDQHDNDSAEMQCICNWEAAKTQIPLCAACITQYGPRDHDHDDHDYDEDDDNEALDLVRSCRFSTTTYNAAAATTPSITATGTASSDAAGATTTAISGSTSSTGIGLPGSSPQTSIGSTGGTTTASPSPGAAAGMTAPGVVSLIAVAGLMPLAWL
ncbi:hypothetical protein F1880_006564 [Penicillium rolfsii]|nr:hypothetical protein F1880_006564 [Penicillium rolfsii]